MPVVITDTSSQAIANKVTDLAAKKAGDLAGATFHLYTNDYEPTPQSVVGDFDEATFTGYASIAAVGWNATEQNPDGSVSTDTTNVMTWVGPGDATGQTIHGYYVLSAGAGTPYIYGVKFPEPVPLATPADVLALVGSFRLP